MRIKRVSVGRDRFDADFEGRPQPLRKILVVDESYRESAKRFFDLVLPRLAPRGLFLAHNVVNKQAEMRDFLAAINNNPALFTTIVTPSGEGMSVSYKKK